MIKRERRYILKIKDLNTAIEYFLLLAPKPVVITETPDGKIRIPGNGNLITYEIDVSIHELLDAIGLNTHSQKLPVV